MGKVDFICLSVVDGVHVSVLRLDPQQTSTCGNKIAKSCSLVIRLG